MERRRTDKRTIAIGVFGDNIAVDNANSASLIFLRDGS